MAKYEYVLGFLFELDKSSVLLIKKERPEWQKGKLNGIGGKIKEGETFWSAMTRECIEETGLTITEDNWNLFCILKGLDQFGDDWRMRCFWATARIRIAQLSTDEKLYTYPPMVVANKDLVPYPMIANVPWLVMMAKNMEDERCAFFKIDEMSIPENFGKESIPEQAGLRRD